MGDGEILMNRAIGRKCGGCSACCTTLPIAAINKPAGVACRHLCRNGPGCEIYEARPKACRDYICAWLMGFGIEEDRPDRSGILVDPRRTPDGPGLYARQLRNRSGHIPPAWPENGELTLRRMANTSKVPVTLATATGKTVRVYQPI